MHDVEPIVARADRRPGRCTPPIAARNASLPMRPMPLMPTLMATSAQTGARELSPSSSRRFFSAIRSSEANGRLTKISSRRRIMP